MKLYHGTAAKNLATIRKHGIKPRGKAKGNWGDTVPSNARGVYLTNAYALYYAQCAVRGGGGDIIILEIDTDRLAPKFAPDEDAVEQALRGKDGVEGSMKERTLYYRNKLAKLAGPVNGHVLESLKALGNCVYMGTVPCTAITRYAVIKYAEVDMSLLWMALDPSITLLNYQICGAKYRNMVRWVFGEPFEEEPRLLPGFEFTPPSNRNGIEVKPWQS